MSRQARWLRWGLLACVAAVALVIFAFVPEGSAFRVPAEKPTVAAPLCVELVPDELETLRIPADVARTMGFDHLVVHEAPPPTPLKLEGSLFLDPNRLAHVHTRFPGEVVEIGNVMGNPDSPDAQTGQISRPIRFGDRVRKGQLMAVVWSKDLGEKKSELIDAISRLTLDQETAQRLEKLYRDGNVPERSLREMERQVESDLIAVAKAERTLRAWRLTNEDIEEIRAEAKRIHDRQGHIDADAKSSWARVEIRAALDAVVVEKNIALGDVIETTLDLFKLADLTRLDVLAHAFEEDVRLLEDLPPPQRQWRIYLKSDPHGKPLSGSFDQIGSIIDPNQHTALVMGWVDNRDGRLRVGQFVTARVELPPEPNEVAVPVAGLIDRGGDTFMFVRHAAAQDAKEEKVTRRKVWPVRRCENQVYVASRLTDEQRKAGLSELRPGEAVVTSGCVELAAALDDLSVSAHLSKQ